jgi:hypothetical protein
MLPASFSPAGVRMLPDNTGFSFIDNGRIRIKEFIKRSARSVDIQESVSNIGLITWGGDYGYFHAKEYQSYRIFSITPAGDTTLCVTRAKTDCMYPVSVEGVLFYIERTLHEASPTSSEYQYRIIEQKLDHQSDQVVCADFQNRPIIFLTMVTAHEGFVVEHPAHLDADEDIMTFSYHQIIRDYTNRWHKNLLFSFTLPGLLLLNTSESRVYESIIPLLPRVIGNMIYYVTSFRGHGYTTVTLSTYNRITQKKENIFTPASRFDCPFVPFCGNFRIVCGGLVDRSSYKNSGPQIYCDPNNNLCFKFRVINC